MISAEIDCNGGKGVPAACHHCADFFAVVKVKLLYIFISIYYLVHACMS